MVLLLGCVVSWHEPATPSSPGRRSLDPEAGCPNFFESKDPSLTYKRIAIFDNRGEEILQYMDQATRFIDQVSEATARGAMPPMVCGLA